MHGTESISPWVARWGHLISAEGRVLDVACGAGRHLLHFLRQKHHVAGIDIAQSALEIIASQLSEEERSRCQLIQADIENGSWPLNGQTFAGVIVTNYLWRPLLPTILQSVAEGGVLIYETFASGNETVGKPSRPDFLLQSGELLQVCRAANLRVIAYEDGFLDSPDRFVQRIVAAASTITASRQPTPARFFLG
ncbi:MAG: class I SAM-dependent methyltransferase [Brachymonas sp.]|nr:class I SAM-dependent methyltransferase [Brachymonas sp.]